MPPERLSIKELSPSGELLGVLTCHAGQITVFRAVNQSDLGKYVRAFAGIQGKDRLVLALDNQEFRPGEHTLIGYGERYSAADSALVQNMLLASGVSEPELGALLVSTGLDSVASKPCAELSQDEERRVRLTAAMAQPHKVLVLNDPFDCISSMWRERFAELLVKFARTHSALVVVPQLSFRPESWIDNESIARLQVGENVQRTIGFGSSPSQVFSVLQQVRQEANSQAGELADSTQETTEGAWNEASRAVPAPASDIAPQVPRWVLPTGIACLLGFIFLGSALASWFTGDRSTPLQSNEIASDLRGDELDSDRANSHSSGRPDDQALMPEVAVPVSAAALAGSDQSNSSESSIIISTENAPSSAEQEGSVRMARVLDLYPARIRSSIVESFEGLQADSKVIASNEAPRISKAQQQASRSDNRSRPPSDTSDLLKVLESSSTDSPAEPPSRQPSEAELQGMSPEQRREVIRQRFLEAIQRASNQNR